MLKDQKVLATASTNDMKAARAFYSDLLGLPERIASEGGIGYVLPDGSGLQVYFRPDHRAAENTAITFITTDLEAEVADLRRRGVTLEEYDLPEIGVKTVDGIATGPDGLKAAWFKDPAGNIIGIGTMPPE